MDSQGGYISKILYVETKEPGPLGGMRRARPPLDPPTQIFLGRSLIRLTCYDFDEQELNVTLQCLLKMAK